MSLRLWEEHVPHITRALCAGLRNGVCVRPVSSAVSVIYAMLSTHLRASIQDTVTASSIRGRTSSGKGARQGMLNW